MSPGSDGRRLWWDDWLALASLAFCATLCAISIRAAQIIPYCAYQDIANTPDPRHAEQWKLVYVLNLIYDLGITLSKISVLLFYARVLNIRNKILRLTTYVVFGLIMLWLVVRLPIDVWICSPPDKLWKSENPDCRIFWAYLPILYVTGVFDTCLDLTLLLLPMPTLWKLQLPLKRRLLTMAAFLCGYIALAASLARLIVLARSRGSTSLSGDYDLDGSGSLCYTMTNLILWSVIEPAVALFSICLPSWFHLFSRVSQYGIGSLLTPADKLKPKASVRLRSRTNSSGSSETSSMRRKERCMR